MQDGRNGKTTDREPALDGEITMCPMEASDIFTSEEAVVPSASMRSGDQWRQNRAKYRSKKVFC